MEIQYPVKLSQKAFGQGKREFVIKDKYTIEVTVQNRGVLENYRLDTRHLHYSGKRVKYSSSNWKVGLGILIFSALLIILGVTAKPFSTAEAMGNVFGIIFGVIGMFVLLSSGGKSFDHYYYFDKYSGAMVLPMIFNNPNQDIFDEFKTKIESLIDKPSSDENKGLLFQHSDS